MKAPKPIERMINEGWNEGNLDVVDECVTEDYRREVPGAMLHGASDFKARMAATLAALPDFHTTIGESIVVSDRGVTRWVARGTHEGPYMGAEPTGLVLEWSGVVWYVLKGDRVAYEWELWDQTEILLKLGITSVK